MICCGTGAGFYNANMDFGCCFVTAPDYELLMELKDTYTYPDHGWTWFNTVQEARAFYGIPEPIVEETNV